jgi:hypothetical protein
LLSLRGFLRVPFAPFAVAVLEEHPSIADKGSVMNAVEPVPIDYAGEPPGSTLERMEAAEGVRLVEPPPGVWHYLKWAVIAAGVLIGFVALVLVVAVSMVGITLPPPRVLFEALGRSAASGLGIPLVVIVLFCWGMGRWRVAIDVTPTEIRVARGIGRGVKHTLARGDVAAVRRRFYAVQLLAASGRPLISVTFNRVANARSAAEHLGRALTIP